MNTNTSYHRSITPQQKLSKTIRNPRNNNTSRSKSPSISNIHINRSQTSHAQCRGHKFIGQLQILNKQLVNNTGKLCSCLQIYSILDNNMQSQRCLQHNNTLSLYCLNQRRILCVNCLYGMHKHRSHKVIPLKDCINLVYEDNDKLKILIEQQIKRLDHYNKLTQQNILILETQLHKNLHKLQNQHKKQMEMVTRKYQENKQQLIHNYQPVIDQCIDIKGKLDDFRYKVFDAYSKYQGTATMSGKEEKEIMKQLLFVNILELCEIRCRVITKSQLENMGRKGIKVTGTGKWGGVGGIGSGKDIKVK